MPVGFTCICICLETGLDEKGRKKMPVGFVFVLCTVIEVGKGKERNAWNWFVHGD